MHEAKDYLVDFEFVKNVLKDFIILDEIVFSLTIKVHLHIHDVINTQH